MAGSGASSASVSCGASSASVSCGASNASFSSSGLGRYAVPSADGTVPVLVGSCGWTDETIYRCRRFYPQTARTAADRLRHYSRYFPCVEIDTSTYAIPRPAQIREWLAVVPPGFLFHIKCFGLFPARAVNPKALPRDLRDLLLPLELHEQASVKLAELPVALVDALWCRMNEAIDVLANANALGVVLFQFHGSFGPSIDAMRHVLWCRRHLRATFTMAVEFRSRYWFAGGPAVASLTAELGANDGVAGAGSIHASPFAGSQRDATLTFLRRLDIVNVPSDDLLSEFPAHEPQQPAYRDGRLLIFDEVTSPDCVYIRLHRRAGTERLIPPAVLSEWARRIQRIAATAGEGTVFAWGDLISAAAATDAHAPGAIRPVAAAASWLCSPTSSAAVRPPGGGGSSGSKCGEIPATTRGCQWTRLRGPVFFMVGTDWEDQPVSNMRNLCAAVAACPPFAAPSLADGASAASSAPPSPSCARPLDWKTAAASLDAKAGLASLFARQVAASASTLPSPLPVASALESAVHVARSTGCAADAASAFFAKRGGTGKISATPTATGKSDVVCIDDDGSRDAALTGAKRSRATADVRNYFCMKTS